MNLQQPGNPAAANSNNNNPDTCIYPRRYFDLAPTWFAWNKLSAADIHNNLHDERGFEGQNIAFYGNHPIRFVRVVGLVVDIDVTRGGRYTLLSLDDGSGACIEVKIGMRQVLSPENNNINNQDDGGATTAIAATTFPSNTLVDSISVQIHLGLPTVLINHETIDIGTILKVKARFDSFKGTRQLSPERVWIVRDTNAEAQAWAEVAAWKREKLSTPWVLTKDQMEEFDEKMRLQEVRERKERKKQVMRRAKFEEKRRRYEEKIEARRLRDERRFDEGALVGSHIIREPWH